MKIPPVSCIVNEKHAIFQPVLPLAFSFAIVVYRVKCVACFVAGLAFWDESNNFQSRFYSL